MGVVQQEVEGIFNSEESMGEERTVCEKVVVCNADVEVQSDVSPLVMLPP